MEARSCSDRERAGTLARPAWDIVPNGILLAVHLGVVMALFLTLPYGKAAHAPFRLAALLKWAVEKRTPNRLGVGGE